MENDQYDITIIISRQDVISQNIGPTLDVLHNYVETPRKAKEFMERLSIAFHGYDQDVRELDEIREVRDFVYMLDDKFPYWLFFLSKKLARSSVLCVAFFCLILKKKSQMI